MGDRDPPLFAGSILGVRSWSVELHLPFSATRLAAAAYSDATWEPGGAWTEAEWLRCSEALGDHRAPQAGCTCGLYALHPGPLRARALCAELIRADPAALGTPGFVESVGVVGVVEAAGRIEVHREGFRAERAR